MSRAFVKEDSDAPPPPPLERPVSAAPNRVTARGARLIDEAIASHESALKNADETSAEALRRELRYWTARRASAQLVAPEPDPQAVGFGVRATIIRAGRTSEIEIGGVDDADPAEGRIAWTSPLARALDGAEPGESVELAAGGRTETIEVVGVAALAPEMSPA